MQYCSDVSSVELWSRQLCCQMARKRTKDIHEKKKHQIIPKIVWRKIQEYQINLYVMCVTVRKLLQEGTSPDASNDDGLTALHQVRSITTLRSFPIN